MEFPSDLLASVFLYCCTFHHTMLIIEWSCEWDHRTIWTRMRKQKGESGSKIHFSLPFRLLTHECSCMDTVWFTRLIPGPHLPGAVHVLLAIMFERFTHTAVGRSNTDAVVYGHHYNVTCCKQPSHSARSVAILLALHVYETSVMKCGEGVYGINWAIARLTSLGVV